MLGWAVTHAEKKAVPLLQGEAVSFEHVREGDIVTRIIGGVPMRLRVAMVDEMLIYCGSTDERAWMFDRRRGAEVVHRLRWGPAYGRTGSYLVS
jgi:hypothetical protein